MIRLAYFSRELWRNLRRNIGTALASLLSLALLFLLFDLFWIAAGTVDKFYRDLLSEVRIEVFVDESVTDDRLTQGSDQLLAIDGVLDVEYVSRDAARNRLADMVGADLLVGYDESNPLPRSYVLTVAESYLNSAALTRMEEALREVDGLSEIHYSRQWLDKTEGTRAIILEIGLALGVLIVAAALVGSANNIRLMTRAQAVGFRQMLLQGAGRFFVAMPYLIESLLISGLAAILGWALIFYGRTRMSFVRMEMVFPPPSEIVLFCVGVALLGAVSGYLGLRKMLRD
jgi:cell division transport system permease protein